jgi:L-lactate dehydrogenase complex protein LldG
MSSRNTILKKLRAVQAPFAAIPAPPPLAVVPLADTSPAALSARFVTEAQKVGCFVYEVQQESEAFEQVRYLIGKERKISAWDEAQIPIANFDSALEGAGIVLAGQADAKVRVGVTGIDAALAATGSLILTSGAGKYRQVSLLPDLHIAVMRATQISADLESWFALQRERGLDRFSAPANTVIITGPSKTADIAQELILGAHGPCEVHIVLLKNAE